MAQIAFPETISSSAGIRFIYLPSFQDEVRTNNVFLLSITSALTGFGFSSTWVFTSLYMNHVLGVSFYLVGAVFTVSGLLAAVAQVYGGRLGDIFGHKRVMIILSSSSTIVFLALFLVSSLNTNVVLFSSLFVLNIVLNSTIIAPSNALISLSSRSALGGFTYLRVANNIGWGFGPFIGGTIVAVYGYPYLYLIGVFTFSTAAVTASFLKHMEGHVSGGGGLSLRKIDPKHIFLGISALLLFMIQGQESVTLTNYASVFRNLGAFDIGVIFFINGLFVILLQAPISKITEKIGLSTGFVVGIFLYFAGFFSMAYDYTLFWFSISMVVATIGEDFAFPAGNALVSRISGNRDVGLHMGLFNAFISMGRSFGPVLGGFALTYIASAQLLWFTVTVSGLLGIAVYMAKVYPSLREDKSVPCEP